jgi:hypothetical protein
LVAGAGFPLTRIRLRFDDTVRGDGNWRGHVIIAAVGETAGGGHGRTKASGILG